MWDIVRFQKVWGPDDLTTMKYTQQVVLHCCTLSAFYPVQFSNWKRQKPQLSSTWPRWELCVEPLLGFIVQWSGCTTCPSNREGGCLFYLQLFEFLRIKDPWYPIDIQTIESPNRNEFLTHPGLSYLCTLNVSHTWTFVLRMSGGMLREVERLFARVEKARRRQVFRGRWLDSDNPETCTWYSHNTPRATSMNSDTWCFIQRFLWRYQSIAICQLVWVCVDVSF